MATSPEKDLDLSVIIPARNEADSIGSAVDGVRGVGARLGLAFEVVVVDAASPDGTAEVARRHGAEVIGQTQPGYGGALLAGFARARGEWVLTMDADLSHPPQFVESLWRARADADLVIASRYVPGGYAVMPYGRYLLSRVLNAFFATALSIPIGDLSSGFRLYRRAALRELSFAGGNFDVLQQILVALLRGGYHVREVPFFYQPRLAGASNARILRFGVGYLRTVVDLWKQRHDLNAADYDFNAFYSRIPLQRFWQRRRYRAVTSLLRAPGPVLDVGSGSSVFAAQYPGVIAVDANPAKLRFLRRYNRRVVLADAGRLPFADGAFATVVCSEVIEDNADRNLLAEAARVLAAGGSLIVGTPDYGSWRWPLVNWFYSRIQPTRTAGRHPNPYTRERLRAELERLGLAVDEEIAILGSEVIVRAVKRAPA
ncbi:MAG: glycosyltransferase [Myxococcales bacterium]|nr:glycosyltransferase [Myxococcales bacterium]